MDYVPGGDLYYHLRRQSKFKEEDVVGVWAAELVKAIGYVHSLGIVFRDLKLENLLLDERGHVHLADFGLSKEVDTLEQKLRTFCGTPYYWLRSWCGRSSLGAGVSRATGTRKRWTGGRSA